jgi:hypothetical protein
MTASISDAIRDMTRDLASDQMHDFAPRFNAALASVLGGFYVGPGTVMDSAGVQSSPCECIISTTRPDAAGMVQADSVACVAHLSSSLDRARLADGVGTLAEIRGLRKTPSKNPAQSTITLGLIVAANSSMSLDEIATEMRALHASVGDGMRPDMLAVLTKGTVHYGASFPGNNSVADFLPPVQGGSVVPPINLQQLVTETSTHALNKACGFLIGHLAFFSPALPKPTMGEVTTGSPEQSSIAWTYQFDVSGKIRDATRRADPNAPAYLVEDGKGALLSRLQLQLWQDGAVIVARGTLPLEGLLPLSGRAFPMTVFPLEGGYQISSVMPVDDSQFVQMMSEIAKRASGVIVRPEPPQFTVARLLDEGTSSPFVARICMTPLMLRDHALAKKAEIAQFDELYQFVMNHLVDVRKTSKDMMALWRAHAARVSSGEIANYSNHIQISESIEQPLYQHVRSFVMDAARVSKQFQTLTKLFGVDIGFLFQREPRYLRGLAAMENSDPLLARYIRESRKWLEPLRLFRDELEHENYVRPRVRYDRESDNKVIAREPLFLGGSLTRTVPWIESSLNCFVEEILVWCVAKVLPPPAIITEILVVMRTASSGSE